MVKHNRYPENVNPLQPTKFQLAFTRLPKVTYFCQTVGLPGLSMGEALQPTPILDTYRAGGKIMYDTLNLTFLVDEQLEAWLEIHDWIRGLAPAKTQREYVHMLAENKDYGGRYSDASLDILNAQNIPYLRFTFKECFPTILGSIQLDSTNENQDTLIADASFRFTYYDVQKIIQPST